MNKSEDGRDFSYISIIIDLDCRRQWRIKIRLRLTSDEGIGLRRSEKSAAAPGPRDGQANLRCPIQGDQVFAPTYVPRHSRRSPLDRVEAKKFPRGSFSPPPPLLFSLARASLDRLRSAKGLRWRSATHPDIISRFII